VSERVQSVALAALAFVVFAQAGVVLIDAGMGPQQHPFSVDLLVQGWLALLLGAALLWTRSRLQRRGGR
jgi:hypothetical protein